MFIMFWVAKLQPSSIQSQTSESLSFNLVLEHSLSDLSRIQPHFLITVIFPRTTCVIFRQSVYSLSDGHSVIFIVCGNGSSHSGSVSEEHWWQDNENVRGSEEPANKAIKRNDIMVKVEYVTNRNALILRNMMLKWKSVVAWHCRWISTSRRKWKWMWAHCNKS